MVLLLVLLRLFLLLDFFVCYWLDAPRVFLFAGWVLCFVICGDSVAWLTFMLFDLLFAFILLLFIACCGCLFRCLSLWLIWFALDLLVLG